MDVPFGKELDDVFRSDRAIGWKMAGSALVAVFVVLGGLLRMDDDNTLTKSLTPARWALLGAVSAALGASLALSLALKDMVARRREAGQPVHRLLKVYFGMGGWSLAAWFVSVIVGAFFATMVVVSL